MSVMINVQIAGGPLNPAIKIAATSIKDGTITQARIDDNVVPLPVKFTVSDANIDDASITTDALSPGDLAPTVDVNNDNVAAGSLALEKYGIAAMRGLPATLLCKDLARQRSVEALGCSGNGRRSLLCALVLRIFRYLKQAGREQSFDASNAWLILAVTLISLVLCR
jgi:hypothetical protein